MKRLITLIPLFALLPACVMEPVTVAPPAPVVVVPAMPAAAHVMYDPGQLRWGDAPPFLPRGAQVAVLAGDPSAAGLFVLRLRMPPGYRVPSHWHATDEHVSVIEGDLTLAMDEHGAGAHSHTFGPGGYALLPARMHHTASSTGGALVQIHGMGPFSITYIDPADDPRR